MAQDHKKKSEQSAKQSLLQELFDDMYRERFRVYKFNFARGLVFGAGSALGGTVVLAVIVWILSLFVNVPLVGELFKDAQNSLQPTTQDVRSSN